MELVNDPTKDPERSAIAEAEIEKLAGYETANQYFIDVISIDGEQTKFDTIASSKGISNPAVYDLLAIVGTINKETEGTTTSILQFTTAFEKGEPILTLIGSVTALENGTQQVRWYEVASTSLGDGSIQISLPLELLMMIVNETCLISNVINAPQ